MPIYEYECPECKIIEAILQKGYRKKEVKCATCGIKMKKIISNTTFHLKGGGWAEDGYYENKT